MAAVFLNVKLKKVDENGQETRAEESSRHKKLEMPNGLHFE